MLSFLASCTHIFHLVEATLHMLLTGTCWLYCSLSAEGSNPLHNPLPQRYLCKTQSWLVLYRENWPVKQQMTNTLWGIKKHTKMCFAITFIKLDGFWTNLADCFLNTFFIKQCKQISSELSTSFVLSAETWKSLIQQRTCTPCTGHHRAATTWNPRLHWTRCLASEFTRPQSSWL